MKRSKKSAADYRAAVRGYTAADGTKVPGLRALARGFGSADGFNLREVSTWTPAQKARVTKYQHEVQRLTAQPRAIIKPRKKADLVRAQQIVPPEAGFVFKVAFIPHLPKKGKRGQDLKPQVRFTKGAMIVSERGYDKRYIQLDQMALVKDAGREVRRAIKQQGGRASRFRVMADVNEMPGAMYDKAGIAGAVTRLMALYDGKKALPRGSGNAGDAPKHHKWDKWLHELVGYEFPRTSQQSVASAVNEFEAARTAHKKARHATRERARRARSSAKVVAVVKAVKRRIVVKGRKASKK